MQNTSGPIHKLKVLGYSLSNFKHSSSNTMFNIEVQESNETNPWTIKRSFDEFLALHKDLKSILTSMNSQVSLPKMAKKSIMPLTKTKSLDKRLEELNIYLAGLNDPKYHELFTTLKFREFFDIQSQSQTITSNKIHLAAYMRFDGFSVGHISVEKTNQACDWLWGIISKVNSEGLIMRGLSALSPVKESKINNNRENSEKTLIDTGLKVGDIVGWHRNPDAELSQYTAVAKITIQGTEASCLDYDENEKILAVGCKNGFIYSYQIDQDNLGEFTPYFDKQTHGKFKVMQVYIDRARMEDKVFLYSVGEDKQLVVCDLKEKNQISSISVSNSRPTMMHVDSDTGLVFLANRKGGLVIMDMKTVVVSKVYVQKIEFYYEF